MNYLAHAWQLIREGDDDPYALAGVATPDWLGVVAKRTKCRSKMAAPLATDADPRVAAIARGVMRHHADDAWFHESRPFNELSLDFARCLREAFGEQTSMRPWFLGHILVELLLDDALAARRPGLLDRYYRMMSEVDAGLTAATIERMCGRPVDRLGEWIGRYVEIRFLEDYADDAGLTHRLNQVMKRVGLPELPPEFAGVLPACRGAVGASVDELLTPEAGLPDEQQTNAPRRA